MLPSLVAAFEVVAPHLPPALVSESARRTLHVLASRALDRWHDFGFECRLAGSEVVDLGISVTPAKRPPTGPGERWGHLTEFAARWCAPDSRLAKWVPFLFLEYDADSASHPVSIPSVFVALDSPLRDDPERPNLAATREAAELLVGASLAPALDDRLAACFDAFPGNVRVLHLGVMLGRGDRGIRLSVLLPAEVVRPYLESLGGSEAADSAARVLELLPSWLRQVQLDFDLDPDPLPRVGFGVRPPAGTALGWRQLLDELVALGCCDPVRAEALLTWPGLPVQQECNGERITLRRELSHIKLVCSPSRLLEAKAYFGVALL